MLRNFLELAAAWNARGGRDGTKVRKSAALQAT
jgi:hypothetical protein